MPDPGWAARTPEANDLLLKAGTGVGTHLANQTAWTTLGASHHASGVASAINTAATAASWLGVGSAASALNVTMLNATLHGLAGWVDVKPAVVSTAIAAFETANAAMRPAPECMENRDEWGVDNAINPSVLWTLTPRIVSLDVEYFGVMWPNNAAVGATYGGVLAALAESLAIPPPVATMGASPAAPAQAAAAVGQAAAEAAAGDGMRSAYQGVQAGSTGAGQSTSAGENFGNQLSTFMQPMQAVMQAAPQALQAPSGLMQAPMSAMQPLQSMVGMFANPGALGMGGAAPGASAASAAGGISAAATEVGAGGGGAALGGGGMPATSFTRLTVCGILAAVAAVRMFRPVSMQVLAICVLVGLLVLIRMTPTVALWVARVRPPHFGSITGRDLFARRAGMPVDTVAPVSEADADDEDNELTDITARGTAIAASARLVNAVQVGMCVGVSLVLPAAVWGVLTPRQPWAWLALLVAGLTVGLFITQGRGFAAKYQAVALVCGASAAVCAGVLKYALDTPKGVQTGLLWPAIFVAAFAALGLAVALVVPATRFRPIIRLTVEWLEVLAMIALLPAAAALGGLFAWLRH